MADNAVYDVNAPGTVNPALEQQRADMQRQDLLNTQGTMIAPAPMQMTPAEQSLSMQKQNGVYNPYGSMDRAAMSDEVSLANQAFPDMAAEQATSQPEEVLQWPEDPVEAAKQSKAKNDLLAPFYEKMAAQNDLRDATTTLEKTRQGNLQQKEMLEQESVAQFTEFKKKYDVTLQQKMAETDAALKQVEEDALNARKGTADLFAEKSTGQKIAAGIAMALGVVHSGLSGSSNNIGVDVVTNALENDRKHNLANFANSKEMLALKAKNMDDYNDNMFKQMQVADRQKLLQMQVISTKLSQAESVYRGSAAGAAAKSANADIKKEIAIMAQMQNQQRALQEIMSKSGGNVDAIDDVGLVSQITGEKPFQILKDRRERTVVLPNGNPVYVNKPEQVKEASQIISANEIIQKNLKILKEEVEKNPLMVKGGGWTKAGQRAQTARGEITAAMKGAEQLGALDNGVFMLVDGIIANPAKIINQADYTKVGKTLNSAAAAKLNPMGIRNYAPDVDLKYKFQQAPKGMVDAKFGQYLPKKK